MFVLLDVVLADPLGVAVSALEVFMVKKDIPVAFSGTAD